MNETAARSQPGKAASAKAAPLSLKLPVTSRERLRALAEVERRPAHALAREAVEAYIEAKEVQIRRDQEANAAWRHYQDTGLHVSGEQAMAWVRSWGTADELPKPVCRA